MISWQAMKTNTSENKRLRTVRSFVLRKGRLTKAQDTALQTLWPEYGISCVPEELLDLAALFQRDAPTVLEIGFGTGHSLMQMALQNPAMNFIGIEVFQTGIATLLAEIKKYSVTNLRLLHGDAVEFLTNNIPDASLSIVQLFFPDPWQKARHHKRRIVQPNFVSLISKKLITNGLFQVATDWDNYAKHILAVMATKPEFKKLDQATSMQQTLHRMVTKFENRGTKLGYNISDFAFLLQA